MGSGRWTLHGLQVKADMAHVLTAIGPRNEAVKQIAPGCDILRRMATVLLIQLRQSGRRCPDYKLRQQLEGRTPRRGRLGVLFAVRPAGSSHKRRMTTYVYDHPSGSTGRFLHRRRVCVSNVRGTASFLDQWRILVSQPPTGTPAFWVSGSLVYEQHPASSTPK